MKYFLIITTLFIQTICQAQADTSLPLYKIVGNNIADFTTDNLGNIYLLSTNNQLKKLNPNGDSVAVFNDVRRFGKLYQIDASNPLKVLLYYKDFSTVVALDRFLNIRNTIDLRRLKLYQVKTIGQSFDNGIWVYDEQEAKLKRVADDGTIKEQTGDLRQQLEEAPAPDFITDQERLVYLYDSTRGLLVFDYFGNVKNKVALTGWQDFQVIGTVIFGRKGTLLERYQLNTLQLQEKNLPGILHNATRIHIAINRLYCLKQGRLYIYSL